MKITLKDGSVKEYENNMSVIDIAKDISEGLARVACAGEVDGEVVDLRTVIDKDCELNILTFDSDEGKHAFRHTASHIMAQAIKRLYPDAKLAIGPSIADGFYFTIAYPGMTGGELMEELIYYCVSAISLSTTGSNQEGLRACTSFIKPHQYALLEERLKLFKENHTA